ncbi:MAG: substrate-binding domain-containing protein [Armatimonadota bacterium]|jgi:ribose transport system substrate-binding protein
MTMVTRAARYILLGVGIAAMICTASCKRGGPTPPVTGPGPRTDDGPEAAPVKWRIGFSQCTTTEPWRVLFNELLDREAAEHPEVELEILDAQDRTENQNAQMEALINKGVDAILISPKESAGLTAVVARATSEGIPVIVLDRDVNTEDYACFVGGNNLEIGREAGRYAVEVLGGEGKARGRIYEIWGGMGSTPAQERHQGFREIVEQEPGITLVGEQDGDWKQINGVNIMEAALKIEPDIDIVYAHNDPMAYGAYLAAERAGREADIKFIGIDANPDEGCKWVKEGKLAATFVYPPPGEKGLQVALQILEGGEPEARRIDLPTRRITNDTVDDYLREKGML